MKLLLIDDDATYAEMFNIFLRGKANVVVASTLEEGFLRLSEELFDVVLIDLDLPDSVSSETVQRVMERFPQAVAVALSGSTDPKLIAGAVKAGAHAYLKKGTDDNSGESILQKLNSAIIRHETAA